MCSEYKSALKHLDTSVAYLLQCEESVRTRISLSGHLATKLLNNSIIRVFAKIFKLATIFAPFKPLSFQLSSYIMPECLRLTYQNNQIKVAWVYLKAISLLCLFKQHIRTLLLPPLLLGMVLHIIRFWLLSNTIYHFHPYTLSTVKRPRFTQQRFQFH